MRNYTDIGLDNRLRKIGGISSRSRNFQDSALFDSTHDVSAITTRSIAGGAVGSAQIDDDAIGSAHIVDLSVTSDKLADAAVITSKLGGTAVTTEKLGSLAVTAEKLAGSAVTAPKIDDDAVTAAKLIGSAVTTEKIDAAAVGSAQIGTAAIYGAHVANAVIGSAHLGTASIYAAHISNAAIGAAAIANAAIGSAAIGTAAIQSLHVADGAILNAKLGTLSWNKGIGGTIELGGTNNVSGVFSLKDEAGTERILMDKTGMTVTGGSITIQDSAGSSVIDSSGLVSANQFWQGNTTGAFTSGTTSYTIFSGTATRVISRNTYFSIHFGAWYAYCNDPAARIDYVVWDVDAGTIDSGLRMEKEGSEKMSMCLSKIKLYGAGTRNWALAAKVYGGTAGEFGYIQGGYLDIIQLGT